MIQRIDRLQTELPPPSTPDPAGAAVVQELLGGKFGEMSSKLFPSPRIPTDQILAEAGEVGHWSIVAKLNERAAKAELRKLTDWALPIQQRHLQDVLDGSLKLAAAEDPDEEA